MKKIAIVVFSMLIILWGCNTENGIGAESRPPEELNDILSDNINGLSQVTPEVALKSITELYKRRKIDNFESNEKPIELYIIYGTDYWTESHSETSETFEMTFAHQLVERVDSALYEYRITLVYNPEEFKGIDEFNLRYQSITDDLHTFKKLIVQSDGYQRASSRAPLKVKIIKEKI